MCHGRVGRVFGGVEEEEHGQDGRGTHAGDSAGVVVMPGSWRLGKERLGCKPTVACREGGESRSSGEPGA